MTAQDPANELELMYQDGYVFYEYAHFDKALTIFYQLILKAPLEKKYWHALASCLLEMKEYKKSLNAWVQLIQLNPKEGAPFFHAAECFLSLGKTEEAKGALAEAKKRFINNELFNKIEALENSWSQK